MTEILCFLFDYESSGPYLEFSSGSLGNIMFSVERNSIGIEREWLPKYTFSNLLLFVT